MQPVYRLESCQVITQGDMQNYVWIAFDNFLTKVTDGYVEGRSEIQSQG